MPASCAPGSSATSVSAPSASANSPPAPSDGSTNSSDCQEVGKPWGRLLGTEDWKPGAVEVSGASPAALFPDPAQTPPPRGVRTWCAPGTPLLAGRDCSWRVMNGLGAA